MRLGADLEEVNDLPAILLAVAAVLTSLATVLRALAVGGSQAQEGQEGLPPD